MILAFLTGASVPLDAVPYFCVTNHIHSISGLSHRRLKKERERTLSWLFTQDFQVTLWHIVLLHSHSHSRWWNLYSWFFLRVIGRIGKRQDLVRKRYMKFNELLNTNCNKWHFNRLLKHVQKVHHLSPVNGLRWTLGTGVTWNHDNEAHESQTLFSVVWSEPYRMRILSPAQTVPSTSGGKSQQISGADKTRLEMQCLRSRAVLYLARTRMDQTSPKMLTSWSGEGTSDKLVFLTFLSWLVARL